MIYCRLTTLKKFFMQVVVVGGGGGGGGGGWMYMIFIDKESTSDFFGRGDGVGSGG